MLSTLAHIERQLVVLKMQDMHGLTGDSPDKVYFFSTRMITAPISPGCMQYTSFCSQFNQYQCYRHYDYMRYAHGLVGA